MKKIPINFFAFVILVAIVSCARISSHQSEAINSVNIDLSKSRDLEKLNWKWPARNTTNFAYIAFLDEHERTQTFDFSLRLSGGKQVSEKAKVVSVKREKGKIKSVVFHTAYLDADEAYRLAKRYIKEWGLGTENVNGGNLDEWLTQAKEKGGFEESFQTIGNDLNPALSLEIQDSRFPAKPWFVRISFYWEE